MTIQKEVSIMRMMADVRWKPDKTIDKPVYLQISDHFMERIQIGEWTVGMRLPSQRDLAERFEVNRSTIVMALEELKSLGFIETNGKGGTKVAAIQQIMPNFIQPDWESFIHDGIHMSNEETIQTINRLEFSTDLIRLSSGEASPDLYPHDMMARILADVGKEVKNLGYEEPKGMLSLREEICRYLKGMGINVGVESILIVSGALQAIQLIALSLLQPGSTVFLEKPSYLYSLNIFQSVGIRRLGIPLDKDGIVVEEIAHLKPKHRQSILYTIPDYHNPTGIVMSAKRRQELYDICRIEQIPIVEDDVYRELWIGQPPPPPIKSLDTTGTGLYIGSVSKTLSPGLRIGWLVGPEAVIERLSDIKMQTDYGSSSLAQHVVRKCMSSGEYEAQNDRLRKALTNRRNAALEALESHFGGLADWDIPQGGYYVWIRFKVPVKMHQLFDMALKKGILAYPGYLYDRSLTNCLRISYSYADEREINTGIRILAELVHKMLRSS